MFRCYSVLQTYLQGADGRALETQVSLEVLSNLPHQALERQLADQQLSGLLVPTDLSQSHGAGPETHNHVLDLRRAAVHGGVNSCLCAFTVDLIL